MKAKLISCRVMIEELRSLLPDDIDAEVLEISLHTRPTLLRDTIQAAVDAADGKYDPIILGYGMCSRALVGIVAQHSTLLIPRADDCIELFLGSRQARRQQADLEPGTYFLTRGWIGDGIASPFSDFARMEARYGRERAHALLVKMLAHYRRLVFIRTGTDGHLDDDRIQAQDTAARFGMEFVEIDGTIDMLRHLTTQDRHPDVIVAGKGRAISLEDFVAT